MLQHAINFATLCHNNQKRKYTNEPYIVHPLAVSYLIKEDYTFTGSVLDTAMCIAILHDTFEDSIITEDCLLDNFGPVITSGILDLTNRYTKNNYPDFNRIQRKSAEAGRLAETSSMIQTIKLADLIDNIRSIVEFDKGFAKIYLEEKKFLLNVLRKASPYMKDLAIKSLDNALLKL
jgi:(p)ppGpp synthase/HD superfamily hydrolase